MEQETGGQRIYRSTAEMAGKRNMKQLQVSHWFKSKRGGSRVTPHKDLPGGGWRTSPAAGAAAAAITPAAAAATAEQQDPGTTPARKRVKELKQVIIQKMLYIVPWTSI